MITESAIYWITRLDPIHDMFAAFFMISFIATIAIIAAQAILRDDIWTDSNKGKNVALADKLLCRVLPLIAGLFLLCLAGRTFLPTTKEMCAIKVIPAIANNEKLQNFGFNMYDLAIEWMKELKPADNGN